MLLLCCLRLLTEHFQLSIVLMLLGLQLSLTLCLVLLQLHLLIRLRWLRRLLLRLVWRHEIAGSVLLAHGARHVFQGVVGLLWLHQSILRGLGLDLK